MTSRRLPRTDTPTTDTSPTPSRWPWCSSSSDTPWKGQTWFLQWQFYDACLLCKHNLLFLRFQMTVKFARGWASVFWLSIFALSIVTDRLALSSLNKFRIRNLTFLWSEFWHWLQIYIVLFLFFCILVLLFVFDFVVLFRVVSNY